MTFDPTALRRQPLDALHVFLFRRFGKLSPDQFLQLHLGFSQQCKGGTRSACVWEGGREVGREGGREGGRKGEREEGREKVTTDKQEGREKVIMINRKEEIKFCRRRRHKALQRKAIESSD